MTAKDNNEVSEGFIKLNILKNDKINNYINCVFLNAPGAPSDIFGIINALNHEINESEIVFIHQQVKKTDPESLNPMKITQKKFNDEYEKV